MKLACADFTWPLLPHDRVLALIRLLDIEGVDLALFSGGSHVRPGAVGLRGVAFLQAAYESAARDGAPAAVE